MALRPRGEFRRCPESFTSPRRCSAYPLWLDSLMETIAECDPQFTPETRAAWLAALRQGIETMSKAY